jgi:hypothetical protein
MHEIVIINGCTHNVIKVDSFEEAGRKVIEILMNIALSRLTYNDNLPFGEMVRERLELVQSYVQDYSKFFVATALVDGMETLVNEVNLDSIRIIVRELP